MAEIIQFVARLFTHEPWNFISWPATAMILGTLVGVISSGAATRLAVVPREAGGLVGLVTAPFIHVNFGTSPRICRRSSPWACSWCAGTKVGF